MSAEDVIHDMLATTYERGARGPDSYDCWGMVCEVARRMGWAVPYDPLEHAENPRELLAIFRTQVRAEDWKLTDRHDGAVAFFGKFEAARHAGIVINGGVLHTKAPLTRPVMEMQAGALGAEVQVQVGTETVEPGGPQWLAPEDLSDHRIEFARWAR